MLSLGVFCAYLSSVRSAAADVTGPSQPSTTAPADAEGAGSALSLTQAREAFLEGMRELEAEDFSSAEKSFRRAARGRPTPGLLYYVAYSQERQGRHVEALAHYQLLRQLLVDTPAADVERLLPDAIRRVQALVAQVELLQLLPTDRVSVHDKEVDARSDLVFEPGAVQIEVRRAGGERVIVPLFLQAGQKQSVSLPQPEPMHEVRSQSPPVQREVEAEEASAAQLEAPTQSRAAGRSVLIVTSLSLAAVGAGVAVVGAVQRGEANRRAEDLRNQLDSNSACLEPAGEVVALCSELNAAIDRRRTATTLTIAGAAAGAALGIGAFVMATLWKPPAKVEVSLQGDPRGGTLLLRGRF